MRETEKEREEGDAEGLEAASLGQGNNLRHARISTQHCCKSHEG